MERGWVDGRDYVIEARYVNAREQAMSQVAAELVATKPDLILTTADAAVRALFTHTKTIPIVSAFTSDFVGNGFATSLRHPGKNVTGLTNLARNLAGKRLQILKEAFPAISHVGVLFEPKDPQSALQVEELKEASSHLKIRTAPFGLHQEADIETAFAHGDSIGVDSYIVLAGFIIYTYRVAIIARIARTKLPAIYGITSFVDEGALMSYAPSLTANFRRAATYADRILNGASPGDLPIEQPTTFELVVNWQTAKTIGLKIPQSLLLRADRVIQ